MQLVWTVPCNDDATVDRAAFNHLAQLLKATPTAVEKSARRGRKHIWRLARWCLHAPFRPLPRAWRLNNGSALVFDPEMKPRRADDSDGDCSPHDSLTAAKLEEDGHALAFCVPEVS